MFSDYLAENSVFNCHFFVVNCHANEKKRTSVYKDENKRVGNESQKQERASFFILW